MQGPGPRSLLLFVRTPPALVSELASRCAEHRLLWQMGLYMFDILFYQLRSLYEYFMTSSLWLASGPRSLEGGLFRNL